jgi:hypothetical protein
MNKKISKNGSSKYIGVSWYKPNKKWKSSINNKFIGYFNNEINAAKARDIATLQFHGKYGKYNYPIS